MSAGEPCSLIRSPAGRVLCAVMGLAIMMYRAATMSAVAISPQINAPRASLRKAPVYPVQRAKNSMTGDKE